MKAFALIMLMFPVFAVSILWSKQPTGAPRGAQAVASVNVGTARATVVLDSKGRRSRIETVEGRSYHVYGVLHGVEKTVVRIQTAATGVKYLCGGLPDNCAPLAN